MKVSARGMLDVAVFALREDGRRVLEVECKAKLDFFSLVASSCAGPCAPRFDWLGLSTHTSPRCPVSTSSLNSHYAMTCFKTVSRVSVGIYACQCQQIHPFLGAVRDVVESLKRILCKYTCKRRSCSAIFCAWLVYLLCASRFRVLNTSSHGLLPTGWANMRPLHCCAALTTVKTTPEGKAGSPNTSILERLASPSPLRACIVRLCRNKDSI